MGIYKTLNSCVIYGYAFYEQSALCKYLVLIVAVWSVRLSAYNMAEIIQPNRNVSYITVGEFCRVMTNYYNIGCIVQLQEHSKLFHYILYINDVTPFRT